MSLFFQQRCPDYLSDVRKWEHIVVSKEDLFEAIRENVGRSGIAARCRPMGDARQD